MLFSPGFDPFNNLWISALIGAVPVILFLVSLTVLKLKGIHAALVTAAATLVLSIFAFHLPINAVLPAAIQGVVQGLWPIGYIIIMAVWLYKLTLASGQFDTIKASLSMISNDQRIQVLLIGFCFGAFLEGVAAFGVPIAICSVMLIALGFKPLQAAALCLIANIAPGGIGAVGIPVVIIDTFNIEGVTARNVAAATNTTLPFMYFTIPFLLVFLLDGIKGIKETLPAILTVSITYTVVQSAVLQFMGAELGAIAASLSALGALTILSTKWRPANIFRLEGAELDESAIIRPSSSAIIQAWMPFIILSVLMVIWSLPFFKALFSAGGPLAFSTIKMMMLEHPEGGKGIDINVGFISAVGTAILVTNILTVLMSKGKLSFGRAIEELKITVKGFWISIATVCVVLIVAKLMTYSGMTAAIGEAVAITGMLFPLLSPILGWIGVFMTGSVVNNNILFSPIQVSAANALDISAPMLVSANTVGGAVAKSVSPASIVVAAAAIGKTGQEGEIMKLVLKYSFAYLAFACIWTFVISIIA